MSNRLQHSNGGPTSTEISIYDFSLSITKSGAGMMKGGKARLDILAPSKTPTNVLPGPVAIWVAREQQGKAARTIRALAADDPSAIFGIAEALPVIEALYGVVDGQRMQFAIRFKNETSDQVVSFHQRPKGDESRPEKVCIDSMLEFQEKKAKGNPAR